METQLESLRGAHILSGVAFGGRTIKNWFDRNETVTTMFFILDGKVYAAQEDPDDGYRSYLGALTVDSDKTEFRKAGGIEFSGVAVYANWDKDNDVMVFTDTVSGRIVLEVGTNHEDNYYPYCVSNWYPQNLSLNHE